MSGHRRVKDIAYDEDDYDYYDGEDQDEGGNELSHEDEEQLRQGTIKVREALGPGYSVSEKEIKDTLWHYYYDISKSVSYLKNSRPASQPKKQKQASRFDQAIEAAAQPRNAKSVERNSGYPVAAEAICSKSTSTVPTLFKDLPWLDVPAWRLGDIVIEPLYPPGGLLGGSSRPSKLAALAASRKRKDGEQKKADASITSDHGLSQQKPTAVALLDRLNSSPQAAARAKENQAPLADYGDQSSATSVHDRARLRKYGSRRKEIQSPEPPNEHETVHDPENASKDSEVAQDLRAVPSTFAQTVTSIHRPSGEFPLRSLEERIPLLSYSNLKYSAEFDPFAAPSPDDIVVGAQSKGAKSSKSSQQQANKVAESVASLSVEERLRTKGKNLNVIEEFERSDDRNAASFVVIGHVDHGKSTLMGRLLYDLKVIDHRSVEKLRKEADNIGKSSFALAWVMDQTSEERQRGVTVDIATNHFETPKTRFTILDAPGHQDFIPNMIAGASQADFAVLVTDASPNSFESGLRGQTKEHALLVRSLGVQRLIVAVNKMDMVSWSQERFTEIEQQLSSFFTSAGFQSKNVSFIPCAGLTGENIVRPLSKDKAAWYSGHTLLEELEASEPTKRAMDQPFRLTISDIFRGGPTNSLSISGRIEAGNLQCGDEILAMPSGQTAHIKAIEVDNQSADWAVAGQIVTLHLTDIDAAHLRLGDVICDPGHPVKNASSFTAKILAFEHVTPMYVNVHRGRLHASARVTKLIAVLDKSSGEVLKKNPRIVQPGAVARIVVELEAPVPLEPPARVVLRAEGQTVAAGLVEKAA